MKTFSQHITKDDNDLIRIASFIADKGIEGATFSELVNFMRQENILNNNEGDELLKYGNFHTSTYPIDPIILNKFNKLISILHTGSSFEGDSSGNKIIITYEGVTSLLDFAELKFARQNSKEAKTYSIWAIGISLLALIASAVIGIIQINGSVKIDEKQFEKIVNKSDVDNFNEIKDEVKSSNQKINYLNTKLDSIEKQIKLYKKKK
jgi:hypothetical protein